MRCMICGSWSLTHICRHCRDEYLSPSLHTRRILGHIPVYAFYRYDEIEPLLLTKHTGSWATISTGSSPMRAWAVLPGSSGMGRGWPP